MEYFVFCSLFSVYSVCRLQVVFMASVAFQLAISGVCRFHSSFMVSFVFCSAFGIHGVCRLQVVFMACVVFQLAISGECRFHSSFMVYLVFSSPFSVHSVCRLQVSGISSVRRLVFVMVLNLIFYLRRECRF